MAHSEIKRVNWFDQMQVREEELDAEQIAWHTTSAYNADTILGSGVVKEHSTQRVLFDSDSVPSSIAALLSAPSFDGEPIYPTDAFSNVVFVRPTDTVNGNQLEIEITGATLTGSPKSRVFLFGLVLGGHFVQEVLEFDDNSSKITTNYFTKLVSFMTQDFAGNTNTVVDGVGCRDVGGRLRIMESVPLTVTTDHIMVEQAITPNMNYKNFKPAAPAKTLDIVLDEIAASDNQSKGDLNINVASTTTRQLPLNSVGLVIGEKFQARTNNIQKVSILLSVEEDLTAIPGKEFDFSGDIVVGIRALQRSNTCPVATIPDTMIEFAPEPSALAEVSFDQAGLAGLGIVLGAEPKVVDFVLTQSLLSNPSQSPIVAGQYYVLTVGRTGDISKGNIVLEEAANTNAAPGETDNMRMTVFSQNEWIDVPESDMWFKVYTSALRVTDGTAFDGGIAITSPKTQTNLLTSVEEQFINGGYSLLDVASTTKNYVVLQRKETLTDTVSHPTTGNDIYSRIKDATSISVVSGTTLTDLITSGNETIILGSATDSNPVGTESVTGTTIYAGLVGTNTFEIIGPSSDITNNNLVGALLTPDTNQAFKYKIIKVELFQDAFGDVNLDGVIDAADVVRCQALDGFSKSLQGGTVLPADQLAAIVLGSVTMSEIIRADVDADGNIKSTDAAMIQQHITLGTAFTSGATLSRAVLTVESLNNPLTTTPNILGDLPAFNAGTFTPIDYQIDFVPIWSEDNLVITDLRRFVPKTFTKLSDTDPASGSGGTNSYYIPGDLLLGGHILDAAENSYNMDMEVATITLDLPAGVTIEGQIDLFSNFIKDRMKYNDGTYVNISALTDGTMKVSVALQGYAKDLGADDIASVDSNPAVEEAVSLYYTEATGVLRIRAGNLRNVGTRPEISTKIVVTVFLKKAGFQNTNQSITSTEFTSLLTAL
jgi:hypothetical protein